MKRSDFLSKLTHLIKYSIPYSYPDTKNDYLPNFTNSVFLETSLLKNWLTFLKTKRTLKKLNLEGLEWTYNNLSDEYSREMMLKVIVYNLFEDVKVRFPLYYDKNFDQMDYYEDLLKIDDEQINLWMDIIHLKKYNLSAIGYDVKLWLNFGGIFIDFIDEQYRYKNIVKVEKGDFVIDGGACYGDTALYFASKGAEKVFSFEFLTENIDIFSKNMLLNPQYKDNIVFINQPLGETSGEKLYAISNGPGTSVSKTKTEGAQEFKTITIDDFVNENIINKLDFIKLDVECSEAPVLRGAIKTIRKFKPKLAICVYHKKDDLWTIPQLIKEICPEYNLYLDHHTINFTETLIYAKV